MERPPIRRDLMDIRLRRGQDSRTCTRHSHANRYHNEALRLPKRQDTPGTITTPQTAQRQLPTSGLRLTSSLTSQSSVRSQPSSSGLSTRGSSIMSRSQASGTTTSTEDETPPIAQLILSAALLKSSSIAAVAAAGMSTNAPVPGTLPDSALTTASSAAQPTSQSSPSSDSAPAQVSVADVQATPSTANPEATTTLPSPSPSSPSSSSSSSSPQSSDTSGAATSPSTDSPTPASSITSSSPSNALSSPSPSGSSNSSGMVLAAGMTSQSPSSAPTPSSDASSSPPSSVEPGSVTAPMTSPSVEASSMLPSLASSSAAPGATEAFGLGGSSSSSSASQDAQDSNPGKSVPTPTVVGSVIGGVAGLSVILVILLFVFRRIKRKRKGLDLPRPAPDNYNASRSIDPADHGPYGRPSEGDGGGSGARDLGSDATAPVSPVLPQMTEQRGFERLSGRKLPSLFSPGMEGPSGATNYPSGSSYYPNSSHYPSGATASSAALVEDPFADSPFADPPGAVSPRSPSSPTMPGGLAPYKRTLGDFAPIQSGQERYHPGPGRMPVVHQVPNVSVARLSAPAASPLLTSASPDSRSSRFQEDFV